LPPEIEYKASVEKDLRRIDRKQAKRILDKIEEVLRKDQAAGEALKGEYKGMFKLRVGDYRIIYTKGCSSCASATGETRTEKNRQSLYEWVAGVEKEGRYTSR
jgi:addiction module RelE/StbE family toxin